MGWFSVPAPFDWLCVGHTKQRSMDTFPKFILSFCWTHSICKEQMIARLSRMNRGTATGTRSKEAILQPLSTHKKKKKRKERKQPRRSNMLCQHSHVLTFSCDLHAALLWDGSRRHAFDWLGYRKYSTDLVLHGNTFWLISMLYVGGQNTGSDNM